MMIGSRWEGLHEAESHLGSRLGSLVSLAKWDPTAAGQAETGAALAGRRGRGRAICRTLTGPTRPLLFASNFEFKIS
eukprot:scaffold9879_cov120-Skeletonema_marinoi.AAC.2